MTSRRNSEALLRIVSDVPDPLARVRALLAARDAFSGEAEALARAAVHEARAAGLTWEDIGRAFGVTRQAAQVRWGALVPGKAPAKVRGL